MLSSDLTEVFSSFVLNRLVSGGRAAGITQGMNMIFFSSMSCFSMSVCCNNCSHVHLWLCFACRMSEAVVSGVRRLSTISEQDGDAGAEPVSLVSSGDSEWAGSSASLCSRGKPSTFTSSESYQPDAAGTVWRLMVCPACRSCPGCWDCVLMLCTT